ncbi:MAG: pyridoxamine 5'-phosphate oxidase family protein [Candidatus Eremiobacter antarcticus]|nr:pyridoxamine 5'-phosphate oxidase family protein [Candidatus Eremiobacteraeota bacterium]
MQQRPSERLQKSLDTALQRGTSVVLATVSADGTPSTAFCTWVISTGPQTIALALDSRGTAYRNIASENRLVAIEVLADNLILSVRARASIIKTQLRSVPFPCALVEAAVIDVRDHGVRGVHFSAPHYVFPDGKDHRAEVERSIFEELREIQPGAER